MEHVLERALEHARRAGSQRDLAFVLNGLARAVLRGPTPVDLALRRCAEILEEAAPDRTQQAIVSTWLAILEAMRGNFERARSLCAESRAALEELGQKLRAAALEGCVAEIELLAGDPAAAELLFRSALAELEPLGERNNAGAYAASLAGVLAQLGRDRLDTQVRWRTALSAVLARRAEHDQAEALAREAVSLAEETDWLNLRGDAQIALAAVLIAGGKDEEGRAAALEAARLYGEKGNVVAAGRAQAAAVVMAPLGAGERAS
jgi:tetratricopeptide (TPR) repeat protein